ncbi:MAG: hypothetical protein OHK0022_23110 [Roseiflexaceae bacterium]
MQIVLIDDEPFLCDVLAVALRYQGQQVRSCTTGERALALIRSLDPLPDLIILDLMLPGMSGPEVYSAIQQDARLAHIPILIITATARASAAVQQCATAYVLYKPFTLEALLAAISELTGSPA